MQVNPVEKATTFSNRQAFTNPSANSGQDFLSAVLQLSGRTKKTAPPVEQSLKPKARQNSPRNSFLNDKKRYKRLPNIWWMVSYAMMKNLHMV